MNVPGLGLISSSLAGTLYAEHLGTLRLCSSLTPAEATCPGGSQKSGGSKQELFFLSE